MPLRPSLEREARAVIREEGCDAIADELIAAARECVYMIAVPGDPDKRQLQSKLRGDPDLPSDFEWPTAGVVAPAYGVDGNIIREGGAQLYAGFAFQLVLEEIPDFAGRQFPAKGLFSAFANDLDHAALVKFDLFHFPPMINLFRHQDKDPISLAHEEFSGRSSQGVNATVLKPVLGVSFFTMAAFIEEMEALMRERAPQIVQNDPGNAVGEYELPLRLQGYGRVVGEESEHFGPVPIRLGGHPSHDCDRQYFVFGIEFGYQDMSDEDWKIYYRYQRQPLDEVGCLFTVHSVHDLNLNIGDGESIYVHLRQEGPVTDFSGHRGERAHS